MAYLLVIKFRDLKTAEVRGKRRDIPKTSRGALTRAIGLDQ
jgi:hypothetical protein